MKVTTDDLEAFGKRWNKKARSEVAFEPEAKVLNPDAIPLDIPAVDLMLGGGMPRGRTSIFIGEPSSGKTLLAQLTIAAAQRRGGRAMFFDIERTYDAKWFALTGVDTSPERLIVARPRSLEQGFDMVVDALESVRPDVIVVDSIPAMVPKAMMLDKRGKRVEMAESDFRGLTARKITEGVAKVTQYNQTTALVFINQLRINMGVTFGNPESMPGGKGLKFYASLIMRVRRGKWLNTATEGREEFDEDGFATLEDDKEARRIGFMLRLRTEKNKCAPPWQDCDLKFFFDGAIDPMGSLIHLAVQSGVIEVTGSYYKLPGLDKKLQGLGAVEKAIRADEELKDRLVTDIRGREG
jgi:recombination protein RecA